ncbi:phosphohistidine phosphatase SixA [Rhodocaloribacter sp.]
MRLYLVRHGIAVSPYAGGPDHARALAPEGVAQLKRQAAFIARQGWAVDRILCSTLLRARQTAALLAPALGAPVTEEALLGPGCSLADLEEVLEVHGCPSRVMIVGHQPAMGHLVHVLTGRRVAMRPGAAAVVETERLRPGAGVLRAHFDPDAPAGG